MLSAGHQKPAPFGQSLTPRPTKIIFFTSFDRPRIKPGIRPGQERPDKSPVVSLSNCPEQHLALQTCHDLVTLELHPMPCQRCRDTCLSVCDAASPHSARSAGRPLQTMCAAFLKWRFLPHATVYLALLTAPARAWPDHGNCNRAWLHAPASCWKSFPA